MSSDEARVRGETQPATKEGFQLLIAHANEVHRKGLVLVSVVALGKDMIGAVYVKLPRGGSPLLDD